MYRLHLTIHTAQHSHSEIEACKTYTWSNSSNTYTETGKYLHTYRDAYGCYTTDTLHLTVYNDSLAAVETRTECESYAWRGKTYNHSGTYHDTVEGAVHHQCDSIYTLNLTVGNEVVVTETI